MKFHYNVYVFLLAKIYQAFWLLGIENVFNINIIKTSIYKYTLRSEIKLICIYIKIVKLF